MTANTPPPKDSSGNIQTISMVGFHWPALAYRNTLVDSDGNEITETNPLFTSEVSSKDLIGMGDLTVGTSEVEITITGTPHSIRIRADTTNTGIIYIGKTGVLADGTNDFVRLERGDEVIIDYNDITNGLFAISDTAAQKLNRGALL